MSGILKPTHMLAKMQDLKPWLLVQIKLKEQNLTLQKLSHLMGKSHSYLHKKSAQKDMDMSLALTLSAHLETNLLEFFGSLLPQPVQQTKKEKQLAQQLAETQALLAAAEKERDTFKAIVMK